MVSAVLFDYGLVLTGPADPSAWEAMKGLLGAGEEAFHAAYWKFRHDYDRGALNAAAYWRAVARELGRVLDQDMLQRLLAEDTTLWTQPNEAMIAWASLLQQRGVKTGILSNIGDAMEDGVMRECVWLNDFTHRTFSHRLRVAKPEAAIYRHAAEGLETPVEEILFIDDREDNIAAARAVGMQAVQYVDHNLFIAEMHRAGFGNLL